MTWHDSLLQSLTADERLRRVGPYAIGDNVLITASGETGTIVDLHDEEVMASVGAVADRLGIEPSRPDQRIQVLTTGNITRLVAENEVQTPRLEWETGRRTSLPEDQRAFLELDDEFGWIVYRTSPNEGRLLNSFPRLCPWAFDRLEDAQAWVEAHAPPRER